MKTSIFAFEINWPLVKMSKIKRVLWLVLLKHSCKCNPCSKWCYKKLTNLWLFFSEMCSIPILMLLYHNRSARSSIFRPSSLDNYPWTIFKRQMSICYLSQFFCRADSRTIEWNNFRRSMHIFGFQEICNQAVISMQSLYILRRRQNFKKINTFFFWIT